VKDGQNPQGLVLRVELRFAPIVGVQDASKAEILGRNVLAKAGLQVFCYV
jgi:hypothetical protein